MLSYFQDQKEQIALFLKGLFARKRAEFAHINQIGGDVCDRLLQFSLSGKMIRGGLVSLGYGLFRSESSPLAIEAGAALELFQSALLVHDDIMDHDIIRRGRKTIFYQYTELAGHQGLSQADHLGESMGICAGDVAFFMAFEILSRMEIQSNIYREILRLCSREISHVGIAQMQDVYWGASPVAVSDEEILKLYLHKTGRYTFSLPLMVGGLLGEQPGGVLQTLEKLGEYLGIIFQIKDDELGLFGREGEIGKPVGSDVREGKKTLFYGYMLKKASEKDISRLSGIYGNEEISEGDLEYVRTLARGLGVKRDIDSLVSDLAEKVESLILSLNSIQEPHRRVLLNLLHYTLVRTH